MKNLLAKILIRVALWLNPNARGHLAPVVEGYKAGKVGIGCEVEKNDIKNHMKKYNCSYRKARKDLIKDAKATVAMAIGKKLHEHIEYDVEKSKWHIIVKGDLKVYIKDDGQN